MKRITQTNEIQSGNNTGVVISGVEKLSLSHPFVLAEFNPDDTITLRAAIELMNSIQPDVLLEEVPFSATGALSLDFTINNRNILFSNPNISAYITDGNSSTKIQGLGEVINRVDGLIESVDLDGLFGTGYILIKQ